MNDEMSAARQEMNIAIRALKSVKLTLQHPPIERTRKDVIQDARTNIRYAQDRIDPFAKPVNAASNIALAKVFGAAQYIMHGFDMGMLMIHHLQKKQGVDLSIKIQYEVVKWAVDEMIMTLENVEKTLRLDEKSHH